MFFSLYQTPPWSVHLHAKQHALILRHWSYYTALPEEDKYAVSFMTPQEILQFLMSTSASELITDNTLNQEQLQQLFQVQLTYMVT